MKLTKYQSRKVMRELLKNFTPIEVAKRMAYMREAGVVELYVGLPSAEESLREIVLYLEDLKECENDGCDNIETDEHLVNVGGYGRVCLSCSKEL